MSRGAGLMLPLTLIGLGVVLLLANLGLIPWDAWESLRKLWPVFLIAWGLDLMLGRRRLRWGVVGLLLAALGLFFGLTALGWILPGEVRTISHPLAGATSAQITLACGGCELRLAGEAPAGILAAGELELGWADTLQEDFRLEGETARLMLKSRSWIPWGSWAGRTRDWKISLSPELPLSLLVQTGIGHALLDLSALVPSHVELRGGIGDVEIVLPARGSFSLDIRTGIGKVRVLVPPELGVRLEAEVGVGDITVPPDFSLIGGTYFSPEYRGKTSQVSIRVQEGVGEVEVRYLAQP